jgi:hypothetical protein
MARSVAPRVKGDLKIMSFELTNFETRAFSERMAQVPKEGARTPYVRRIGGGRYEYGLTVQQFRRRGMFDNLNVCAGVADTIEEAMRLAGFDDAPLANAAKDEYV